MRFVADLHLHSRFARATSKALNPSNLHRWSALKGIAVVGTGDFTHPVWFEELQEQLEPAEEGLYRLKAAWRRKVEEELPPLCRGEVRFMLTVEISSIYKKNGRTRKVHNVVMMPGFEAAAELNRRLGALGNLKADGRPILGLDSRDLLEICLEACEEVLFVPAHIWTPHFAVLGAASGFESLEECFEDLLPHIFALETGLSSDPPMNWRLSALDRFALVSNSDAHSPPKLAREATCFDAALSYPAMYSALEQRDPERFGGTLEFYPQEGKYHYDGHRKCRVRWRPGQTLAAEGKCPECGRRLTVGVLHRVELLADRPEGAGSGGRKPFEYLIPLPEVIGAALGVGPGSKKVMGLYEHLLGELGPELEILRRVPPEQIARCGGALVAEGVRRMRAGEVEIAAGYDGEYGTIELFSAAERESLRGQALLFDMAPSSSGKEAEPAAEQGARRPQEAGAAEHGRAGEQGLDPAQRRAVEAAEGPVVVVAGPGSGKTRTLTRRIAHLIRHRGVEPAQIMALTFTNRAAGEMRQRLRALLGGEGARGALEELWVGTFHRMALELLGTRDRGAPRVLDEMEARALLAAALAAGGVKLRPAAAQRAISRLKAEGKRPGEVEDEKLGEAYRAYQERLGLYEACDCDDLLLDLLELLEEGPTLEAVGACFAHLLVDEFQDLNAVQYRLVKRLAGEGRGLFVIGDPDQAIYGFRGADPGYFRRLNADFPAARRIFLGTNYRSREAIVRAAAAVIGRNGGREPLELRAQQGGGAPVRLLSVPGERAEGIAVVREIGRMVGGADMVQSDRNPGAVEGGRSFGDFAVLFRTGRQAEVMEECFLREGLPYRLIGQRSFLAAASVRRALAFWRFVLEPGDGLRLLQVLEAEGVRPERKALERIRRLEAGAGRAWLSVVVEELDGTAARKLRALAQLAERYGALAPRENPALLLRRWQRECGLAADADCERLASMAEQSHSMKELLDTVLLGREADCERRGAKAAGEAVHLMTLHAAKGLEFPVVFICGMEDGILPLRESRAALEEERRLFYVGLTRAREEVVLLRARRRARSRPRAELSPFVREIPQELLVEEQPALPKREHTEQLSLF